MNPHARLYDARRRARGALAACWGVLLFLTLGIHAHGETFTATVSRAETTSRGLAPCRVCRP
jgi:hypothetical protein